MMKRAYSYNDGAPEDSFPLRRARPISVRINMPDGAKLIIELPSGETADSVMRAALSAFGMVGSLDR